MCVADLSDARLVIRVVRIIGEEGRGVERDLGVVTALRCKGEPVVAKARPKEPKGESL